MLKYRILTALILIPIFVALLLTLSPKWFCILTAAFVLWGAWEWSFFMGIKRFSLSLLYPAVMLMIMVMALTINIKHVLYLAVVGWLIAFFMVVLYPKGSKFWGKSVFIRAWMGVFVLIPCWLAVNFIFRSSPYILLFLMILIWGADSGAYFIGKKWGKHKLLPLVSPGKSIEGLLGALFVTILIALGTLYFQKIPHFYWLSAIVLSIVTVLFSVLGDLFESMLKRNAGLKDSGQLLPGHGGVLDRIDSLTAAAPVFALGGLWMWEFFH